VEIYTLDPLLRREYVFDTFKSLIWTERWQAYGDFELDIVTSTQAKTLLKPGTLLAMNLSHYVMRIETVEDGTSDDGERILTISGGLSSRSCLTEWPKNLRTI
jgi:hypothetical protein